MPITFQGLDASQLNRKDAEFADKWVFSVPGRRTCIYSDATGQLRRVRLLYKDNKPIGAVAEVLNEKGDDFTPYAHPSLEWAARKGVYTGDIYV